MPTDRNHYHFDHTCGECLFMSNAHDLSDLPKRCHALPPATGGQYPVVTPLTAACGYYRPALRWNNIASHEPGVITMTTADDAEPHLRAVINLCEPDGKARADICVDGELEEAVALHTEASVAQAVNAATIAARSQQERARRRQADRKATDIGHQANNDPEWWRQELERIAAGVERSQNPAV